MTDRRLTVRCITVGGTGVQHWLDGNVLVIAFGEEMDEVTRKRAELAIRDQYGLGKRRAIPLLGGAAGSWQSEHPVIIHTATGIVVSAVAAAVILPAVLHSDKPVSTPAAQGPGRPAGSGNLEPKPHSPPTRRPPTRAGKSTPALAAPARPAPARPPIPATAGRLLPRISAPLPLARLPEKPRPPHTPAIPDDPGTVRPPQPPVPVPPADYQLAVRAGNVVKLRVQWHKPAQAGDAVNLRLRLQVGKGRPIDDVAAPG